MRVLGRSEHVEPTVTVRTTDHDGCPVTAVSGEIDSHSVTSVEVELSAQPDRRPGALVLDLNAVVADQREVLRVLSITELDRVFTIHPRVPELNRMAQPGMG